MLAAFSNTLHRFAGALERAANAFEVFGHGMPSREYVLVRQLATGDLADIHLAVAEGEQYVAKIARPRNGGPLMAAEARHLRLLMAHCGEPMLSRVPADTCRRIRRARR